MVASARVRVRYAETDCMKVVYYSNYLVYFEVGRVEYLRRQGRPISAVDREVHMPVVEAHVRFLRPARLDDLLEVRCWVSERKRASFRFDYEILGEGGDPVATGWTVHACWDPATGRLVPLPPWLRDILPVVDPRAEPAVYNRPSAPARGGA
jgi:acyl-CoA thioester hydrolase